MSQLDPENTTWIIDKYRESTVSLEYYGDSIVNSVADIGACALGYAIAASVPAVASAIGFVTIELVMLLLIRDSFLLNVVMLVYPLEAIKQWQLGGVSMVLGCGTQQIALLRQRLGQGRPPRACPWGETPARRLTLP